MDDDDMTIQTFDSVDALIADLNDDPKAALQQMSSDIASACEKAIASLMAKQ